MNVAGRSSTVSLTSDASAGGTPRGHRRKIAPPLQVPQSLLVDFLTHGYGYDDNSVSSALDQGNDHFERRELQQALDFYGAAYEIGRLHCVYPPLMHDLLVRRILCHSMMGDVRKALAEVELALLVLPNSATVKVIKGILLSKLGRMDDAAGAFQQAVAQCYELRDFADCVVALYTLAQGHSDRTIQICTQVLDRSPGDLFALMIRGDAYKFHPSGFYVRQASDDYSTVLARDKELESFLGNRPDELLKNGHVRADELLLRFHPWLLAEPPRKYSDYPMFSRRKFMHVVCLVTMAVAKLRTLVQSTKLVRSVWQEHEELLRQRASAERRMHELIDAQSKVAAVESHQQVWGPADPDTLNVRKYRRYWMEKPLDFPMRGRSSPSTSTSVSEHSRSLRERSLTPPKFSLDANRAVDSLCGKGDHVSVSQSWTSAPAARGHQTQRGPVGPPAMDRTSWDRVRATSMNPSACNVQSQSAPCASGDGLGRDVSTPASSRATAPAPDYPCHSAPDDSRQRVIGMTSLLSSPALSAASRQPPTNASQVSRPVPTPNVHAHQTQPQANAAPHLPLMKPSRAPPEISTASHAVGTTVATPSFGSKASPAAATHSFHGAAGALASVGSEAHHLAQVGSEAPKLKKIGQDWDDKQWIAKALELAEAYSTQGPHIADVNLVQGPADPLSWLNSRKSPVLPAARPLASLDAAGISTNTIRIVEAVEGNASNFKEIPKWYRALDEIYEVTDMINCTATPEPLVAAKGFAGAPGHSYIVPPKSPQREKARPVRAHHRSQAFSHGAASNYESSTRVCRCGSVLMSDSVYCRRCGNKWVPAETSDEAGVENAAATTEIDDITMRRYQNRLLGSALHGASSIPAATAPAVA